MQQIAGIAFRLNLRIYIIWAILAISIVSYFWSDGGRFHYNQLLAEKTEIKASIQQVIEERKQLQEKLDFIRKDRRFLGNIAREKLGMIKRNETVYEVEYR